MKLIILLLVITALANANEDKARVCFPLPHSEWNDSNIQNYLNLGLEEMLKDSKKKGEIPNYTTATIAEVHNILIRTLTTRTYYLFETILNYDKGRRAVANYTVEYLFSSGDISLTEYNFYTVANNKTDPYNITVNESLPALTERLIIFGAEYVLENATATTDVPKGYFYVAATNGSQAAFIGENSDLYFAFNISLQGLDNDYDIWMEFIIRYDVTSGEKEVTFFSYEIEHEGEKEGPYESINVKEFIPPPLPSARPEGMK